MSTRLHVLSSLPEPQVFDKELPQSPTFSRQLPWDPGRFAQEQLRRLVRQVFSPGWPRPSRHVAFVAIDDDIDTGAICMQVGQILSSEIQANTCVVEADRYAELQSGGATKPTLEANAGDSLRNRTRRISSRLWLMPQADISRGLWVRAFGSLVGKQAGEASHRFRLHSVAPACRRPLQ